MQDDDGDKVAKTAKWLSIAKRVIGGLNTAINGEKLALNQDDDDDDGDDLLNQAALLVDRMVSMQDDDDDDKLALNQMDDDDDDDDKAKAQFGLHFHFG